ncbi:MAG: hypothetical protein KBG13_06005, partial [Syntrophaceae bacterium]|nr:hypothetical protein [Syntrophaceae bacterium]
ERKCGCNAQQRKNQFCNFLENGVAILWKNDLQLSGKMSCKKHPQALLPVQPFVIWQQLQSKNDSP